MTGRWTVDNQQTTFRINKFDLDSTDRSTELEGVLPESTISAVDTTNPGNNVNYRVSSVIDQGTYMNRGSGNNLSVVIDSGIFIAGQITSVCKVEKCFLMKVISPLIGFFKSFF